MKNLLRNISAKTFNSRFSVGTKFRYYQNPGIPDYELVRTTSKAWHLHKGRLVVKVEGRLGGVSVNRLEPLGY